MPITRERFAQGLTVQQFLDGITKNEERFQENLRITGEIITDADVAFWDSHPVSVAAIGEDWCTDVVQFFPPMFKLAERSNGISELRVFLRDQNLDIMDQYLNQGEFRSIPTFVFYDADWNELGHFIERPARVTDLMAKETLRFAQENAHLEGINRTVNNMPEETRLLVRQNSARYRWENMLEWNRMFLDEIREIVERNWKQG